MAQLVEVDATSWANEVELIRDHYAVFGATLPPALARQLDTLEASLRA